MSALYYSKLAVRSFRRNRAQFLINTFGLSSAFTCALLIALLIRDETQIDKFHKDDDRIFQIMENKVFDGEIHTTMSTRGLLAETVAAEVPEAEYAITHTWLYSATMTVDDKNDPIGAKGIEVGKDFFQIFDYSILMGSDQPFEDINSIAISESTAKTLFGSLNDAMGESVLLQRKRTYQVSAVFEDVPDASSASFKFDFLLGYEGYKVRNPWVLNWENTGPRTIVKLKSGFRLEDVEAKISSILSQHTEKNDVAPFLTKFSDLYLRGEYKDGIQSGGRIRYIRQIGLLGLFIIIVTCINFINLFTSQTLHRNLEVGIRKSIGAKSWHLFNQYTLEAIITFAISMILAISFSYLLMPYFNWFVEKNLSFNLLQDLPLFILSACFLGFISALFPVLHLSTISAFKGIKGINTESFKDSLFRKGLVVVQFSLTIVLIGAVFIIRNQLNYLLEKDLGYTQKEVVYFQNQGKISDNPQLFIEEVKKVPGIADASLLAHNMTARQMNAIELQWPGKSPEEIIEFEHFWVGHGLFQMLNFQLAQGRSFSEQYGNEEAKIIFNEAAVKAMKLDNPIGKSIRLKNRENYEIIGVVEDFHFQSLHTKIRPAFFLLRPESSWTIMVKLDPDQRSLAMTNLTAFYHEFNPGFIFNPHFLEDDYKSLYGSERQLSSLSSYLMILLIIISCLGILGLANNVVERKFKEILIRKVHGATIGNIVYLLTRQQIKIMLPALIIAIPSGYLLTKRWLDGFVYRIDASVWYFLLGGVISLVIASMVVAKISQKAAQVNLAHGLRQD